MAELICFLTQWDNPDSGLDDLELIESIELALSEAKAGLGIKHGKYLAATTVSMKRPVFWLPEAIKTYHQNIYFLRERWYEGL